MAIGPAIPLDVVAVVAQLVEHVLGKDEVKGSSPFNSFRLILELRTFAVRSGSRVLVSNI
jgi:hypothetical protein